MIMTEAPRTLGQSIRAAFRAVGRFIGRHKVLFIVLALVLIAGILALVLLNSSAQSAAAETETPKTVLLEKTDLQQMVAGTGTLQSSSPREVSSSLSYEIAEVHVKEGDKVTAGALLATLDTADLDKDIAEMRKNVSEAEAKDALSLSQAERKLQDAISSRDINQSRNEASVQSAYKAIEQARVTAGNTAGNAALEAWATQQADAAATAEKAAAELEQAKLTNAENYYYSFDPTDEAGAQNALSLMQQAQANLAAAQSAFDAKWQAEYQAARAAGQDTVFTPAYNTAYSGADVSALQTSYEAAVQTRDTSYRTDTISVQNAQDTINTQKLQDSAASYRTQLEDLLENREDCQITAPVGGTVTSVGAQVGKSAGGAASTGSAGAASAATASSALFTIEDANRLEITASIPEYDVVNLRVGMQVKITTDALPNGEWTGTVGSISAKATDDSGNFTVVVDVISPAEDLAIGMSAKINIITESKADVFAVPYDAVTTGEAGETVVYVVEQDMAGASAQTGAAETAARQAVAVQTGMETDYYIEISGEGLKEGMLVLTDPENKTVDAGTAPEGIMAGMGGEMPRGG